MSEPKPFFVYRDKYNVYQPEACVEVFREFFTRHQPDQIIELGTAHGGLTTVLADLYDPYKIKTYGNYRAPIYQEPADRGVQQYVTDIFEEHTVDGLEEFIQRPGTTLLLCDNGNKIREFQLFAPMLKPGDMIMAHEYNLRTCPEWIWEEISAEAVQPTIDACKLIPFEQELMARSAWMSMIKPL